MTLSQIAKIANVSVSTVSKAFSDSPEISRETKDLIIRVAKENGCYEKYYKPRYDKKVIAVISPEMLGIHYSEMITYLENDITSRGGTMIISVSGFSKEKQAQLIEYYTKFARVDGIIVIEPVAKIKASTDLPIIQIALEKGSGDVHAIFADTKSALYYSMNLLLKYGHKEVGFVGEKYTPKEFELFKSAAVCCGVSVPDKFVSTNEHRFYDCGYYGINEIIERGELPSVVFAAYSHIAVGIMQRLGEAQIRVPEDISLLCLDDIVSAPYSQKQISCIKLHLDSLCSEAVELLYRIFKHGAHISKHTITVERQFVQGQTIGKNTRIIQNS